MEPKDNCLIESTCCVIFSKLGSAVRDPHSRSLKRAFIQQTYSGIWNCTLKKYARLINGWFKTVCLVGLSKEMLWNSQDWVFSHQGQILQTNVREKSFVAHVYLNKHEKYTPGHEGFKKSHILPTGQWYAPSAVNYSAYSAYSVYPAYSA